MPISNRKSSIVPAALSTPIIAIPDDGSGSTESEVDLERDELQGNLATSKPVRLGAREFGETWKVRWTAPGGKAQIVAVKYLRWVPILLLAEPDEQESTNEYECFQTDIKRWCSLRHRNVVQYLGYRWNKDKGEPSLVSPYSPFGNIHMYLERRPHSDVAALFTDIASGLEFLHGQSPAVIHGELRPGNVIISPGRDRPLAVLADFGQADYISRARYGLTTGNEDSKVIGYFSPEFVEAGVFTTATDIYSFGSLMLHVLSGNPPLHKLRYVPAMTALTKGATASPQDHPTLPADSPFWPIMQSCWMFDADSRPSSRALCQKLDQLPPTPLKPRSNSFIARFFAMIGLDD